MKLFYRKYGTGPPLVILHGLYGSSDNWVTVAKKISDSFTVYLPDLRNHGQSSHSNDHDYNFLSSDLLEFTEDLNIEKLFLTGHSMGGKVAVDFAIKWPEKINSLIVIDISPFRSAGHYRMFYKQHFEILNTILSINPSELASRNEADALLAKKIDSEKIRGLILKSLRRTDDNFFAWRINAGALLANLGKIMDGIPRPNDDTSQISGFPVLFIKGEDSQYLPLSDWKDIQRIFPAAEIIHVKNAGHWIHADKPEIVVKSLLNLL